MAGQTQDLTPDLARVRPAAGGNGQDPGPLQITPVVAHRPTLADLAHHLEPERAVGGSRIQNFSDFGGVHPIALVDTGARVEVPPCSFMPTARVAEADQRHRPVEHGVAADVEKARSLLVAEIEVHRDSGQVDGRG